MPARRFWILTVAAAIVGVAVRSFYVLDNRWSEEKLISDPRTFHGLGKVLAAGRGYIRPAEFFDNGLVVPTAEFPPAYPMLLAALDLVGVDQPTGQRLAGAVLGGVTIVVIALLGAAVAGRTVGLVAAVIAALYPQLVVLDGSLLSEGPYVLFVATAVLGVVRARGAHDVERRRWWILAGVATGLAVMTRSEALLLVPLLLVPATRVPGDLRTWGRTALVASSATLVLLGAWTIRNALALDEFLPLTNNSGTMLAGANCDAVYDGVQIGGWRFDCVPAVDYGEVSETTANAQRRDVAFDHMRDHATDVPRVMVFRVARTFGAWDIRVNLFFESLEGRDYDWLWAGWYSWLALGPLAVAGAVLHRRSGREVWPLLVPFAVVLITALVSYGNQRFRSTAEPSVAVLAAIALVTAARTVVAPSRRAGTDDTADEPADGEPADGDLDDTPVDGAEAPAQAQAQAQAPGGSS